MWFVRSRLGLGSSRASRPGTSGRSAVAVRVESSAERSLTSAVCSVDLTVGSSSVPGSSVMPGTGKEGRERAATALAIADGAPQVDVAVHGPHRHALQQPQPPSDVSTTSGWPQRQPSQQPQPPSEVRVTSGWPQRQRSQQPQPPSDVSTTSGWSQRQRSQQPQPTPECVVLEVSSVAADVRGTFQGLGLPQRPTVGHRGVLLSRIPRLCSGRASGSSPRSTRCASTPAVRVRTSSEGTNAVVAGALMLSRRPVAFRAKTRSWLPWVSNT